MPTPPVYQRSPRLFLDLPTDTVAIPPPPPEPPAPTGSTVGILLPLVVTALVIVLIALIAQTTSILLYVALSLLSGAASVVTQIFQKRTYRQKMAERATKYQEQLARHAEILQKLRKRQQTVLLNTHLTADQCLPIVQERQRYLWVREPEHQDFLLLRLGIGSQPSSVTVTTPATHPTAPADPLLEATLALQKQYATLPDVPVCLPIRQAGVSGLAGSNTLVTNLVSSLLMQLATHHAPDQVKIGAIFSDHDQAVWLWLRWLPHTWNAERTRRYLANDLATIQQLLAILAALLDQRTVKNTDPTRMLPNFVLLFTDPTMADRDLIIRRLQVEGPAVGIYPVFISEHVRTLPPKCRVMVHAEVDNCTLIWQATDRNATRQPFAADAFPTHLPAMFATAIAPLRLANTATQMIPDTVSLLEMLEAPTVEALHIAARWRASITLRTSLAVPIGLQNDGKRLLLDLHERADGPNGLVAGTVGSGKSELLQTVVLSLAIQFHPHKLAFVLIDYKGGGMAEPLTDLPHTLGIITNLQRSGLAKRALDSLLIEAERRQRLFGTAGVNHIDAYQRAYDGGRLADALPYLVIIVDEFAEMKADEPEVANGFVRIARTGRALGLLLILAMQKPGGIVADQIEANTRFRLCLRVAQVEDSQAMLKRPDAAYLTGVGRAYLQVGLNATFAQFQVAWSGAVYDPNHLRLRDATEIMEIALNGSRRMLSKRVRLVEQNEITQLQAVVAHLRTVAQAEQITRLPELWLPPLPNTLTLAQVRAQRGWNGQHWAAVEEWLTPIVGLVDDPAHQRQGPAQIDLGRAGHLIVYGAPGYGKTTFLQTLILALALDHTPDDVHLYVLDFGGRLLKGLEALPHVGGVVLADESEKSERLFRLLTQEIDRRQKQFAQVGVAGLPEYRATTATSLPALVLVINNYANFASLTQTKEEMHSMLVRLARDGGAVGLHLVLTATHSASVPFSISSNVVAKVAFHLAETGEYGILFGRIEGALPAAIPGRGLLRSQPALEVQIALPTAGATERERQAALRTLIMQIAKVWPGLSAPPVPVLPERIAITNLLKMHNLELQPLAVPLGLYIDDLTPLIVDLQQSSSFLITGPPQSGKSTLLRAWCSALAQRLPQEQLQIYLFDSERRGLEPIARLPQVQAYTTLPSEFDLVLQGLQQHWLARTAQKLTSTRLNLPAVLIVVDDMLDPFADGTSESGKQQLATLLRQSRMLGLYLLVAGAMGDLAAKGWSEPVKLLKDTQCGFMLGSRDDTIFNLRLPYSERNRSLNAGEGYYIMRSRARGVKLALPD